MAEPGRKISALFVIRSLGNGGAERQLAALAKGLHQHGHKVEVATFYRGGLYEKGLIEAGITVICLEKRGRWDMFGFFWRLVKLVRARRPDVLHSYMTGANIFAALIRPFIGRTKIVWGVRASNVDVAAYNWAVGVTMRAEALLSRFADLVISNSHAGLEYASANGFSQRKMVVIPNGIDTEYFKSDAEARQKLRQEWGIAETEILIGSAARLDPMKDHPVFLRAMAKLARERADVRFVCVGDGPEPYKTELCQLADELGLATRLLWLGARFDMPAVYSALDLACSSSLFGEGFSNTVAEAMACSVPCVVTDVGDSALIVGEIGEVVVPGSPDALLEGFQRILRRLKRDIGAASRASIVSRFSSDALVLDTMEILCRMV